MVALADGLDIFNLTDNIRGKRKSMVVNTNKNENFRLMSCVEFRQVKIELAEGLPP
jgi:NAD(P)H-hydrate repair Nnr-like enzyme with NAD(P)H-hydrate dehydratase domain